MKNPAPRGRLDPELFAYQFGASADLTAIEAVMNRPIPDCICLFADFCSYSVFVEESEDVGPALRHLARFCDGARELVLKEHGMIDRVQGDGLLCVFGLTGAPDPAACLGVAGDITALARDCAASWQTEIDRTVRTQGARVGMSLGPVSLIGVPSAYPGFSLLGQSVNLSARLCQAADPNEILVSNRFYRALSDQQRSELMVALDDDGKPGLTLRHMDRVQAWSLPVGSA